MVSLQNAARNTAVEPCLVVRRMSIHYTCFSFISTYHYRLNYTWVNQDRKSINLTAPTYIDYVMTWVQNLLDDGKTFPTKLGTLIATQTSESGALTPCRARFPSKFPHHGQTRVSPAPSSVCTHIPCTLSSNFASSFRTAF